MAIDDFAGTLRVRLRIARRDDRRDARPLPRRVAGRAQRPQAGLRVEEVGAVEGDADLDPLARRRVGGERVEAGDDRRVARRPRPVGARRRVLEQVAAETAALPAARRGRGGRRRASPPRSPRRPGAAPRRPAPGRRGRAPPGAGRRPARRPGARAARAAPRGSPPAAAAAARRPPARGRPRRRRASPAAGSSRAADEGGDEEVGRELRRASPAGRPAAGRRRASPRRRSPIVIASTWSWVT